MNTDDILERSSSEDQNQPQSFQQPRTTIKDKAQAVQQTAQEWQRKASEATQKAATATDNYVRENPWSAVAYAAIGCLVIGFLIGRSRD